MQLTSTTPVPLGQAMACFVFVAGLVWWLARKLQRLEDKIDSLEAAVEGIEHRLATEERSSPPTIRGE